MMQFNYDFKKYIQWCEMKGLDPLLPPFFEQLRDPVQYRTGMIQELCGVKSDKTVRRWFQEGKIRNESGGGWNSASGLAWKQFFFNRSNIIKPIMKRYPEYFSTYL